MPANFDEWFYRERDELRGPISPAVVKQLIAAGRVQPRQPIWKHLDQGKLFVHANTVAARVEDSVEWACQSTSFSAYAMNF